MNRELYRELWKMRFEKMLELEEKSIVAYGELLSESRLQHKGHPIEPHLERLIADETRHAHLAKELLAILACQS